MTRKIIFIGGNWQKHKDKEIIDYSIGSVQNAANIFQWKLIEGLDKYSFDGVTILSAIFIGSFPILFKKAFIRSDTFNHTKNINHKDYYLPFLNLPIIKHLSRIISYRKYIRKVVKDNKSSNQLIFVGYSMTLSTVLSLIYAKSYEPKSKTVLIIPDLPEFMNLGREKNIIFRLLKSFSNYILYFYTRKIDSYVLSTEYMKERIDITNKKYCVVEGVVTDDLIESDNDKEPKKYKDFVYTGTLDKKYGICELVDEFRKIQNDDIRLIICGYGDSEKYIKENAKNDERIIFKGSIDNATVRKIQANSFCLVNPRNKNEEYTKYSFPSKTLEYMASGRPILMYKLKGIKDEYDQYLIYIEGSIHDSLIKVLNMNEEELNYLGERSRSFAIKNKNKDIQARAIIDMVDGIEQ